MKHYLQKLAPRERLFVMVGAGLAAVLIVVQGLIIPVVTWRNARHEGLQEARTLLRLVADASRMAPGLGVDASDNAEPEAPVRNIVVQSATDRKVSLIFVNARPDGSVEATTASADPGALFDWLADIEASFGISVLSADIARDPATDGLVRAQVIVARRGA